MRHCSTWTWRIGSFASDSYWKAHCGVSRFIFIKSIQEEEEPELKEPESESQLDYDTAVLDTIGRSRFRQDHLDSDYALKIASLKDKLLDRTSLKAHFKMKLNL